MEDRILYVVQLPISAQSLSGGVVINDRNFRLLKEIFKEVFVYEYKCDTSNKVLSFLQSVFGINVGLTRRKRREILNFAREKNCNNVFIGTSRLGDLAKTFKYENVTVFFHNVEILYVEERIKNCNVFIRLASVFLLKNIRRAEKRIVKYAKNIIALNERDSQMLELIYSRKADFLLPITFKDNYSEQDAVLKNVIDGQKRLLFIGSDFFGNTEGLFWFIENCMDYINADLIIVGSGMDKYSTKYDKKNVHFLGFVKDLANEYYKSDLVILPILSGSGMKTKTCEALMYGKKIIASQEAFEGYVDEIFSSGAGVLCKSAEDYINEINFFLNNEKSKMCVESRGIFEKYYSNELYCKLLKKEIFNK